ncbi:sugar-specific transcriptional regulator TrmB [Methanogenium organophilum]|uniref:Sugar-specific transcriptional regulator TrmB n=1 Tax=Methanogenium organophilum TaxID=2199 RepID=A0A9X9T775_METOG|nr:sugar-specific transcriptional regulator TrmB [Methanogenium organophilum]WAI01058.1 sugar-specific transcriptional regulator TrmB [Methanogenium organophilum]
MAGVIEKRRELLGIMREFTLEYGFFTINDIADATDIPRSTIQDWINRLVTEQCVAVKEEKKGRAPARYMTTNVMMAGSCRRIFTTTDGDLVAIYHQCMSTGCAAFCEYHHRLAGGVIHDVKRDGRILVEYARLGTADSDIGLYPKPAVGVTAVRREGDYIIQTIRCVGGPAYSLTDMMAMAVGVCEVRLKDNGGITEGEVVSRALTHLVIGIDDTDSKEGGATFALALGLLQYLGKMHEVIPINHSVAMLFPGLNRCTAGNSCSFIEIAVNPDAVEHVIGRAVRFIASESLSKEWGIAVKKGFCISDALRGFGLAARDHEVTTEMAITLADSENIILHGGNGRIGAIAAIGLLRENNTVLLNPGCSSDLHH